VHDKRFYTPKEVADELQISSDTVLRMIASGRLAAIQVSERIYRIPAPAIEALRTGRVTKRRQVVTRRRRSEPKYGKGEALREPAGA